MPAHEEIVAVIRDHARAAAAGRDAFAPLLQRAREARLVLLEKLPMARTSFTLVARN